MGANVRLLDPAGYQGDAPDFPLPRPTKREVEVWRQLWRTPQAIAWADEPWRWLTVGHYVRQSCRLEQRDAPAVLVTAVTRLAVDIGMTPAGLRENGWAIRSAEHDANGGGTTHEQGSDNGQESARLLSLVEGGA